MLNPDNSTQASYSNSKISHRVQEYECNIDYSNCYSLKMNRIILLKSFSGELNAYVTHAQLSEYLASAREKNWKYICFTCAVRAHNWDSPPILHFNWTIIWLEAREYYCGNLRRCRCSAHVLLRSLWHVHCITSPYIRIHTNELNIMADIINVWYDFEPRLFIYYKFLFVPQELWLILFTRTGINTIWAAINEAECNN